MSSENDSKSNEPDALQELLHSLSQVRFRGVGLDAQTRCAHYRSEIDVIAIQFKCCRTFYCCFECHEALADHQPERWTKNELNVRAILCGQCGTTLEIAQYIDCDFTCPTCGASFNPGCKKHYDLYFEVS